MIFEPQAAGLVCATACAFPKGPGTDHASSTLPNHLGQRPTACMWRLSGERNNGAPGGRVGLRKQIVLPMHVSQGTRDGP